MDEWVCEFFLRWQNDKSDFQVFKVQYGLVRGVDLQIDNSL